MTNASHLSQSVINLCKVISSTPADYQACIKTDIGANQSVLGHSFPSDVKGVLVVLTILYPLVALITVIGNLLVIFVVLRLPHMRKSFTNFFLVNMAIADMCVGIFCTTPTLLEFYYFRIMWKLGPVACKLNHFVQFVSFAASVLDLLIICIERYIAIVFPLKLRVLTGSRYFYFGSLSLIWSLAVLLGIPNFVNYDFVRAKPSDEIGRCVSRELINMEVYYYVTVVLLYVVPLIILCSLYGQVCWVLWHSHEATQSNQSKSARSKRLSQTDFPADCCDQQTNSLKLEMRVKFQVSDTDIESSTSKRKSNAANQIGKTKTNQATALGKRRKLILMLVVIVVTFIVCKLIRHIWTFMYFNAGSKAKHYSMVFIYTFPPFAFLCQYLNSALNPIIIFVFSKSFRQNLCKALSKNRSRNYTYSLNSANHNPGA